MGALMSRLRASSIRLVMAAFIVGTAACQAAAPVCPEMAEQDRFLRGDELEQALRATPAPYSAPTSLELGGREISVDKVISGPLCNDTWHGTVYVGCDVRVPEWAEAPTFLRDCRLEVEPGTIVYVAAHNNTAYYQGCSCHTGEIEAP